MSVWETGTMRHNFLQTGVRAANTYVKCTNVRRDNKIERTRHYAKLAVIPSCAIVLSGQVSNGMLSSRMLKANGILQAYLAHKKLYAYGKNTKCACKICKGLNTVLLVILILFFEF